MSTKQLTITQTATGYWVVRRGEVELAGAVTRAGAEAERELVSRLHRREPRPAAGKRNGKSAARGRRPGGPAGA